MLMPMSMSGFIVDLTNGVRKEFETVETLEDGWVRCTRARKRAKPDLPGDETTKYYPLERIDAIETVR